MDSSARATPSRQHQLIYGSLHMATSTAKWHAQSAIGQLLVLATAALTALILLLLLLPWILPIAMLVLLCAPHLVVRLALRLSPAVRAHYAQSLQSAEYSLLEAAVARNHKRHLFERVAGSAAANGKALVVDIGAGVGHNLHTLERIKHRVGHVIAVEPNEQCFPALQEAAMRAGLFLTILACGAEHVPLVQSGTVDAVICTFTLCSVIDPTAVLRESARMLRPGGLFIFVEHVGAPLLQAPRMWLVQKAMHTPWCLFTGGCHIHRNPEETIPEACRQGLFAPQTLHLARYSENIYATDAIPPWVYAAHAVSAAVAAACRAWGMHATAVRLEKLFSRVLGSRTHVSVFPVWAPLLMHQVAGCVNTPDAAARRSRE